MSLAHEGVSSNLTDLCEEYTSQVPYAQLEEGLERLHTGQEEFPLFPAELLNEEPVVMLPMLVGANEPLSMQLHTLHVIARAASGVAPAELIYWYNWEKPEMLGDQYDESIYNKWEDELYKLYSTFYEDFERKIAAIRAQNFNPDILRIRPVFTFEDANTPLTEKWAHCIEATMWDVAKRKLVQPLFIRLDADTTMIQQHTLPAMVRSIRERSAPITKARTLFTGDPSPLPLSQKRRGERIAALYGIVQRMAEEPVYRDGGALPYTDEVGTGMAYEDFARVLGPLSKNTLSIGESRALQNNVTDTFHIQPQKVVNFLPDARLGTSNRTLVRSIEATYQEHISMVNRLRSLPLHTARTEYSSYNERATAQDKLEQADCPPNPIVMRSPRPNTPREVTKMVEVILELYRPHKITERQKQRISLLIGRLGLDKAE